MSIDDKINEALGITKDKPATKNIVKKESLNSIIYKIIENENFASKKWIYEQYDSSVMGDTISIGNKSDASIVKIHSLSLIHI